MCSCHDFVRENNRPSKPHLSPFLANQVLWSVVQCDTLQQENLDRKGTSPDSLTQETASEIDCSDLTSRRTYKYPGYWTRRLDNMPLLVSIIGSPTAQNGGHGVAARQEM